MPHHSHAELFYHFVWATYNREKKIHTTWEGYLYDFIRKKGLTLRLLMLEINGTEDHVHVLLRSITSLSPAQIGHDLKGVSSHMVNTSSLCESHFDWQIGYGVFSVSPHDIEKVALYIRNQKQHHANSKIIPDWENTGDFEESNSKKTDLHLKTV
jgi:putative transposase